MAKTALAGIWFVVEAGSGFCWIGRGGIRVGLVGLIQNYECLLFCFVFRFQLDKSIACITLVQNSIIQPISAISRTPIHLVVPSACAQRGLAVATTNRSLF
jgi:hypothetical protein